MPSIPEMDDSQLARAAAGGDAAAVEALLQRHLPGLRAFVRLRAGAAIRARESCSDLVQSTCREILTHLDRFQHPGPEAFKHWLYTTALRKIARRAEYLAAAKREAAREVPLQATSGTAGAADLAQCYRRFSSPSHRLQVQEEIERVERAFDALTEEQREVVTLVHVVGLSRAEIAERLGKREGAVRMILHRALARLSGLLEEDSA